jgi:hypothetical protein
MTDELKAIFDQALEKYEAGALQYGQYDPATDQRDMLAETEAEILDAINYLAMFLLKLRATGGKGKTQCCKNQSQLLEFFHEKGGCKACRKDD